MLESDVGYIILPVVLPLVKIRCYDARGREDVTVLEDTTGWSLNSVNDACEAKFEEWVASR